MDFFFFLKKLNAELLRKLNVMNFWGISKEIGRKSIKIFPNSNWKKYQKKIVSSIFKKKRKKKINKCIPS